MATSPRETVTFLFSDVEGSTRLLERHGDLMGAALARHHAIFEEIVGRHHGTIFETVGDAVYAAFALAGDGVAAALDAHVALAREDWGPIGRLSVRVAIHTGEVERRGDHYFGPALFRAARLQAIGYGEQTVLSSVTAALVGRELPTGASLRDLGSHRLKDLGEPERVYQLVHPDLREEFPLPRSLDSRPHNLPRQLTSFVGREREVADVAQLLDENALVTLLGPGGIGKTRLALQVAAERLERHADGIFFIDLAPVSDAFLVTTTIAATLGLREVADEAIGDTLADHLSDRQTLLVLDNLEQLMPGVSATARELLLAAPKLRILATSRAPLRISGEHEYPTPPLSASSQLTSGDEPPPAVSLFIERARAVRPELAIDAIGRRTIAEICTGLDGLPLAIELAAARIRLFSLSALRDRLGERLSLLTAGPRDLPERQRTLRDAIAWSSELLSAEDRRLFARLSVFIGGFTLDAAEAIAGRDGFLDVPAGLERLVENSLVRLREGADSEPRYGMLETIGEYARSELSDADAALLRRRHLDFYGAWSERIGDTSLREGRAWRSLIEDEIHNLRSALATADRLGDGAALLAIMSATHTWWLEGTVRVGEACMWMERGLAQLGDAPAARADALYRFAYLLDGLGDVPRAERLAQEAALLAEESGDDGLLGRVLRALGTFLLRLGRDDEALGILERAILHPQEAGDHGFRRQILVQIAEILAQQDARHAAEPLDRALALAADDGDSAAAAAILTTRGYYRLIGGDARPAVDDLRRALSLFEDSTSRENLAFARACLSQALADSEPHQAREALSEALLLARGLDEPISLQYIALIFAASFAALGEADDAARMLGAADAASIANAVGFQRLERILYWRVLRRTLVDLGRSGLEEAIEGGCAAGAAASIDRARNRWRAFPLADDPGRQASGGSGFR